MTQLTILESSKGPGGDTNVHIVAWYPVPAGRELPIVGATSANPLASPAEVAAIQAGQVIEESYWTQYPNGTGKAAVKADLISHWTDRNTAIQAQLTALSPKQFYGTTWNGTTWSS